MESLAIIAEFNPFHTGHARLIRQVRQAAGPEAAIVIIMSGAFVQRGEPAFSINGTARPGPSTAVPMWSSNSLPSMPCPARPVSLKAASP